ncbi:RtcB family protein [Listeria goaensis]|uniref:RtcB family protein n=1 Tax=Listeria goaensis TaxID=1649188 RepID=UPI000B58AEB6|nr:RtcB family protein [Listeria goaensis]
MFVNYEKKANRKPIKIWLESASDIEAGCLEQAKEVARLPFVFKWLALMPDTHFGKGMPIGGVLATKDVIVPYAVGMDIGCGMCFIETNILARDVREIMPQLVQTTLKKIPVGKGKHSEKQISEQLDGAEKMTFYEALPNVRETIEYAYYQIGTLGGGNHFIEFQEDEKGYLCIMLHSGSRHLGAAICTHFDKIAQEANQKWYSNLSAENALSFLPIDSEEGRAYIEWMNFALDYAYLNRETMLNRTMEITREIVQRELNQTVEFKGRINCHHNYASLETHYDEQVYVHRKGATSAKNGELGIIPGAMGSKSYITMGLGSKDSFHSSSHGAGRNYSRTRAKANFPAKEVLADLENQQVTLGKTNLKDVAEESRYAYKDIDQVMQNQKDLVAIVKTLHTLGVIKG